MKLPNHVGRNHTHTRITQIGRLKTCCGAKYCEFKTLILCSHFGRFHTVCSEEEEEDDDDDDDDDDDNDRK